MVGRQGLRHGAKFHVERGRKMGPQLTTFSFVHAAVVSPHLPVRFAVFSRVECEDRHTGCLAVARRQPEITSRGLG